MLLPDIDDIDALECITTELVQSKFRFAAFFVRCDDEVRQHAASGDALWFAETPDEPGHSAFKPLRVQTAQDGIGLLALHPSQGDDGMYRDLAARAFARGVSILRNAIAIHRADQEQRRRARLRRGDWGSRELPRSRDRSRASSRGW